MNIKNLFLLLNMVFYLLPHRSQGQQLSFEGNKPTGDMFLRKIVPPSPTAASLGKYGDQQANLFSGTPGVNIPIYEIKSNGLSVPLSLSYSSSGLKVTEAASWVGLGWTLNGIGVVTRIVRGAPDFVGTKDYFNIRTFPLSLSYSQVSDNAWDYLHSHIYDYIDPEPDLYMVHAGSLSFKFYYDMYKRIQTIPYNNRIKINVNSTTGQYEITDETGTIYYFGGTQAIETTSPEGAPPYTSSWYLKKISVQSGGEINFSYTIGTSFILQDQFSESEEVKPIGSNVGDCSTPTTAGRVAQFSNQSILPCFLNSIDAPNETVYFVRDAVQRLDLPGDYTLKEIKVFSKSSAKYVYNYSLDYSYFPQVSQYCWGHYTSLPAHIHDQQAICKRLRLDKFTEKGDENNTTGFKIYQFQYSTKPVPSRCSLDQDHWGYYNGANNNSLLPPTTDATYPVSSFNANSREANQNYSDAGLLQKIIYPTGGETDFVYEPNQVETAITGQSPQTATASLSGISPLLENSVSFTITNTPQRPIIKFTLMDVNLIDQGLQRKLEIRDQSGALRFSVMNYNTDDNGIFIPSAPVPPLETGTYTLRVSRNYVYSSYPDITAQAIMATVYFNPQTTSTSLTRTVGGFRVKRITDKTDSGTGDINVKEFVYEQPYLIANIVNDNYKATYVRSFLNSQQTIYRCNFLSRNSSSVQPVGTIQGAHIGYGKVTTLYGTNGTNGKSEQFFSVDPDQGGYSFGPINRPVTSYDHRRGNLLKKIDYNSNGDILKITANNYEYILKYLCNFTRPYYRVDDPINAYTSDHSLSAFKQVAFLDFSILSEWVRIKNTSETIYSSSNYITTTKEFSYGNPNNTDLTQTKITNSKGEIIQENITYPLDYKPTNVLCKEEIERNFETSYQGIYNTFTGCANAASGTTALNACYTTYQSAYDNIINNRLSSLGTYQTTYINLANATSDPVLKNKYKMIAYNLLAPSIESVVNKNGTAELVKTINYYNDFASILLPSQISKSVLANPQETEITFNAYDSTGNILQATPKSGIVSSYIWDYKNSYPIAQISNAANTQAAHTSFEADGKGNWNNYTGTITTATTAATMPPTGNKYYSLTTTATLSKTGIISGKKYIVSYWSKNGAYSIIGGTNTSITGKLINGWTYYEHTVTATTTTITISGTGSIDEIRLYPSDAQMTTYTYQPLIGLSSQCDLNNRISYYEYDALGRLRVIKDQDKNVLKKVYYNYAGQPVQVDPPANVTVTITNYTNLSGFIATYTNASTGQQLTQITIPSTGNITATVPPGTYNITVSRSAGNTDFVFTSCSVWGDCGTTINNINVSSSSCNTLIVDTLF